MTHRVIINDSKPEKRTDTANSTFKRKKKKKVLLSTELDFYQFDSALR